MFFLHSLAQFIIEIIVENVNIYQTSGFFIFSHLIAQFIIEIIGHTHSTIPAAPKTSAGTEAKHVM